MNYEQKFTLIEEAKLSLQKFKGDEGVQREKSSIKLEPAYLAENEETLLETGYVKAKTKNNFDNRRRPRWDRSGWVQNTSNRGFQKNFSPKFSTNKKMNPVGTDGQTLTCKCCGSFCHLIANCSDTLANQGNVNVTLKISMMYCLLATIKMKLLGRVGVPIIVLSWIVHVQLC